MQRNGNSLDRQDFGVAGIMSQSAGTQKDSVHSMYYNTTLPDGEGGGLFFLADKEWLTLLALIQEYSGSMQFCCDEKAKKHTRAFADCDLLFGPETPFSKTMAIQLAQLYVKAAMRVFDSSDSQDPRFVCHILTASAAQTKNNQDSTSKVHKWGVHLVMPNLIVTRGMLLVIRLQWLDLIYEEISHYQDAPPEERAERIVCCALGDWADALDAKVYHTLRLRVPYAHKVLKAQLSKLERDSPNSVPRHIWERVFYEYYGTLYGDAGSMVKLTPRPDVRFLCLNVYSQQDMPGGSFNSLGQYIPPLSLGFKVPSHLRLDDFTRQALTQGESSSEQLEEMLRKRVNRKKDLCASEVGREPKPSAGTHSAALLNSCETKFPLILNKDSEQHRCIMELIRKCAPSQYRDLTIATLKANSLENPTCFIADVQGREATYCPNLLGYHTSSKVYFLVSSRGLFMRCRCRKDRLPQGSGIRCSEFKLELTALSNQHRLVLFPQSAVPPTKKQQKSKRLSTALDAATSDEGCGPVAFQRVLLYAKAKTESTSLDECMKESDALLKELSSRASIF